MLRERHEREKENVWEWERERSERDGRGVCVWERERDSFTTGYIERGQIEFHFMADPNIKTLTERESEPKIYKDKSWESGERCEKDEREDPFYTRDIFLSPFAFCSIPSFLVLFLKHFPFFFTPLLSGLNDQQRGKKFLRKFCVVVAGNWGNCFPFRGWIELSLFLRT